MKHILSVLVKLRMFERFQCLKIEYCNELHVPFDSNLNVMKTQCSLDTLQMGACEL